MNNWKYFKQSLATHSPGSRAIDLLATALFNTGFHLVCLHKVSHHLCKSKMSYLLGLFASWLSQTYTGCHISHKALIDSTTRFPHPTGIVIGDNVVIKGYSTIYQNVTLGAKDNGYPKITSATIYPGSVVVGKICIGENAKIGALSFVSKNVDELCTVMGIH